jgi:hypothetical protein
MCKVVTAELATAKAICRDYASLQPRNQIDQALDASDVQELWVRVFKRQEVLRMFEAPRALNRAWARAELLADLALSGVDS